MTIFARLFGAGRRATHAPNADQNLTTAFERERLARSMPGEVGARAGSRFGLFV